MPRVYGDGGNDLIFALDVGQAFGGAGDDRLFALSSTVELYGDDGSDVLSGGDGVDHRYYGGAGNDRLLGANGDEILDGGGGDDAIEGGSGTDTATYGGSSSQYQFDRLADGSVRVVDQRAGSPDGTDSIRAVELLQFADGTFTLDQLAPPAAPEIAVSGGGVSILDNNLSPSAADGTDFGSVTQGSAAVVGTFTVRNDGGSTLTLGTPSLPAGFSLVTSDPLEGTLAPGAFDTFQVQLDTDSAGTKSGQISFSTDDGDENPFDFQITGMVSLPNQPDVEVADITAPASVVQGQSFNFSYLIQNAGNVAAGHHYTGIMVDQPPDETHYIAWDDVASLAAGGQSTLSNSIATANLSLGQHTLYIKEDYWQNMVGESDETDNVRSVTFNVTATLGDFLV